MSTKVLLQCGTGECVEMMKITEKLHQKYCDKWGIRLIQTPGRFAPKGRHPYWHKTYHQQVWSYMLPDDAMIWVLDCDTVIMRNDVDIFDVLPEDKNLGMVKYNVKRLNMSTYNSGSYVVRNTPETRAFFDTVISLGQLPEHWITSRWGDEGRINEQLPYHPDIKLHEMPFEYNAWVKQGPCENPIIKAWHTMPKETIRRRMQEAVDTCLQQQP